MGNSSEVFGLSCMITRTYTQGTINPRTPRHACAVGNEAYMPVLPFLPGHTRRCRSNAACLAARRGKVYRPEAERHAQSCLGVGCSLHRTVMYCSATHTGGARRP